MRSGVDCCCWTPLVAVGAMVAFTIYLRQRDSSESEPVRTPYAVSSVEAD